jgi:hypothetical protein
VVADDRRVTLLGAGTPGADQLLARVTADLPAAVTAVEKFWGTDWPHDIVIVAAGDDAEFAALAGSAVQAHDIAAVAVADSVDPVHRTAAGQRIVLAPGAARMNADALRIVLTHELFHYAARIDTATDAPAWLAEGVADYVARPPTPPAGTANGMRPELPSDVELATPGPARSLAYDRAWWFTRFIADRYGAAALREMYLRICGTGHVDTPTATREVLHTDVESLLADWQHWLDR